MKKVIIVLFASFITVSAFSQELMASSKALATTMKSAKFNWDETVYDFGKIEKDVAVTHKFTFTNSGDGSLVITAVKASCGCTVAEYSQDPIPAGEEGFVKATYNAAKVGLFTKTVTINANTESGTVVLTIKGEVIE
jgi:hypothetical protein